MVSENLEENIKNVGLILEKPRVTIPYTKLKKYKFQTNSLEFLGVEIIPHDVCIEKFRVNTINDWPRAKMVKHVQIFLGFANFYQYFTS